MQWPQHPVHPSYGYVVRRRDLDTMVAEEAVARGATLLQGTEALRPILRDGLLAGAVVKDKETGEEREIHARYVVIADGSLSRFGRALGGLSLDVVRSCHGATVSSGRHLPRTAAVPH